MTDPEFQELADLWQESDGADKARFVELARRARRQGRLLAYADFALAALIVGSTIFGIVVTPQPTTIAIALVLIVATVWLTLKRRGLRQMAATLNTSDPIAFLESSARNATAGLRRANLSLMLIPLFMVSTILFKASVRGGDFSHMLEGVWTWASSWRGMIALGIAGLVMAVMVRSRRRLQEELRRLERLRLEYEEESHRE